MPYFIRHLQRPQLAPKLIVCIRIRWTRYWNYCLHWEKVIRIFGRLTAIVSGRLDEFVLGAQVTWGKLIIASAPWGRNSSLTLSSSHLPLSSSMRAQTFVLLGKFFWGDTTQLACESGSHLSPRILTRFPSPILHFDPNHTTLLAFSILNQAHDPFNFTPSSRIVQSGKYFDLKTL